MRKPSTVLGVSDNATPAEITSAYRTLVKKFHPDLNHAPDAEARFKEVQTAYEALTAAAPVVPLPGPVDRWNISTTLTVTLEEIISGAEKEVTYQQLDWCSACHGRGSTTMDCSTCKGVGATLENVGIFQFMNTQHVHRQYQRCRTCKGRGGMTVCSTCHGLGSIARSETKTVVLDPTVLGSIAASGPSGRLVVAQAINRKDHLCFRGDLGILITVIPNPEYFLVGKDVHHYHNVPFTTFVDGGDVDLTYFSNTKIKFTMPPLTQPGYLARIGGRGVQVNPPGDLVIHVNVSMPQNAEEKEILAHALRHNDK